MQCYECKNEKQEDELLFDKDKLGLCCFCFSEGFVEQFNKNSAMKIGLSILGRAPGQPKSAQELALRTWQEMKKKQMKEDKKGK